MGKFTSKILSLVMALAITVMAVPVSVSMAADNSILDENYEFYELVYSPSLDMYVAAAKDYSSSNHSVKFYASADALSWKEVFSGNSRSYANPKTRQQLVWIENPGMFAAIFADGTYTSNDGLNWERNATLSWSSAGNIATNGEQIAVAANDKFRMWENATTAPYEVLDVSDLVNEAGENTYYADNVAISPKDADGNMQYIVLDGAGYDTYSHNVAGTKTDSGYTYAKTGQGIYNYGDGLYNTIYNPVTKNWLTVNGKQNLFVIYNAGKRDAIQIPGVTAISAVALNDAYIVAGTADGKLFYTENTENGLTKSVWTEIPCTSVVKNTEEVTNIAFSKNNEFVALSKTQIYTGTIAGYSDITEYKNLGQPVVAQKSPFSGVKLLGGAYSPELDTYIVYGNAEEGGRIFTSTDGGASWVQTHAHGIEFSTAANGAVWWPEQEMFIVSSSTNAQYGTCWTSKDGLTWSFPNTPAGLGMNSDLAIRNGNLYTTNNETTIKKYTELNNATADTSVAIEKPPALAQSGYYCMRFTADYAENPSFLAADTQFVAIYNGTTGTWSHIKIGASSDYGAILDVEYIQAIDKFIVTHKAQKDPSGNPSENSIVVVAKEGTSTNGPSVAGVKFNAVLANDNTILFGGNNGMLYTIDAVDGINESTAITAISAAVGAANRLPVTSIFAGAAGKFFVTASDGTESDILIVDAQADEYYKVSDNLVLDQLVAGQTLMVSAESTNNTDTDVSFTMVTAIYDGNKLLQVVSDDKTMAAGKTETQTQEITLNEDIPETATMKVYMWDSLSGMQPVSESTGFFG